MVYNDITTPMKTHTNPSLEKLDSLVINIEFLLISVVQGVALGALASSAAGPIGNFQFEYWLYAVSGFLFILNFWSAAIIHTISFIDWPLEMLHNFSYFLVSFVEVMAFYQLTNPLKWFEFSSAFFVAAMLLYLADFSLIRKHEQKLHVSEHKKALYNHIVKREKMELTQFLPLGFICNLGSAILIRFYPELFITQHYHILLVLIQVISGLLVLISSIQSFKKRSELLTAATRET